MQAFDKTCARRLETTRRPTGVVERQADRAWLFGVDHLDCVAAQEQTRARTAPMVVCVLVSVSLERQVGVNGTLSLDRDMTGIARRRHGRLASAVMSWRPGTTASDGWWTSLGRDEAGRVRVQRDLLATLRRCKMTRVAGALTDDLGLPSAQGTAGLTSTSPEKSTSAAHSESVAVTPEYALHSLTAPPTSCMSDGT